MTTATLAAIVLIGGFIALMLMRVPVSFAMLLSTLGCALVTGTNLSVLVRQMVDGVLKDIKTITEVDEKGKKTVKQTMETVREVAKTITATTSGIVDGIQTSTKTVTETLTDGTETQKQVITETYDDVVDGALVTVERVKTIAADGTEEVAETTKEASIKSFDDLWKELQTHADTGLLGTFDDLYTAVKNKDWKSIGLWAANAIYGGLTAEQKKQVNDFAIGLVDKLNEALGNAQTALVQKGIDIGAQICKGLTSGFDEVWTQAKTLGTQLTGIFKGLKAPLSSAALAISQSLSGGLLSSFPAIYAGVGTMVGTIGAAFEGMMTAIASALNATVFGIPMGVTQVEGFTWTLPDFDAWVNYGLFKLDFSGIVDMSHGLLGGIFSIIMIVLSFSLVDMFDTIGTLVGTANKAGMIDKDGNMPRMREALACADLIAAEDTRVTMKLESSTGISEGGRTGLTSLTTAVLFLLALFLAPLVGIVPSAATAPAFIIVGVMMLSSIKSLELDDMTEAIPAFLTIVMMPFAYSIATGIAFGLISYTLLKVLSGRAKEVSPVTAVLAIIFIIRFACMAA